MFCRAKMADCLPLSKSENAVITILSYRTLIVQEPCQWKKTEILSGFVSVPTNLRLPHKLHPLRECFVSHECTNFCSANALALCVTINYDISIKACPLDTP